MPESQATLRLVGSHSQSAAQSPELGRYAIDRLAEDALNRWHNQCDSALTHAEIPLADAWHSHPVPLDSYHSAEAAAPSMTAKASLPHHAFVAAIDTFGLPPGPQPGIMAVPYNSTLPVLERMPTNPGTLADSLSPGTIPARPVLNRMVRGGRCAALPNAWQRRCSARLVRKLSDGIVNREVDSSAQAARYDADFTYDLMIDRTLAVYREIAR